MRNRLIKLAFFLSFLSLILRGQGRINLQDIRQSGATTSQCATWNGTIWAPATCITGVSAAITTINSQDGPAITLAVGTSGTDFAISAATDTVTFNLPTASSVNRGALTAADWTTFNAKESALTFSAPLSRSVNTVSCPTCEVTTAKNTASGYAGLTASTKLTASQGQEVWALADLTDVVSTSGTGTTVPLSTITTPVSNQYLGWSGTNWINRQVGFSEISGTALTSQLASTVIIEADIGAGLTLTAGVVSVTADATNQQVRVSKGGILAGTRREINIIESATIIATVADNAGSNRVDVTLNASGVVPTTRTLTGGVGIAAIGDLSIDRTVTFDATELTNLTWSDGLSASVVWTYNLSGTDPVVTFGSGVVNVSTGTLQQGGTAVVLTSRQILNGTGITGGGNLSADRTLSVVDDTTTQKLAFRKNSGSELGTRRRLNFIEGANVTLTVADDSIDNEGDITIAASGTIGYQTVQEESVSLTQRTTIDFVSTGITASDTGSKTQVSLDADLDAIAALAGSGIAVRSASNTWVQRSIVGAAGNIVVTNGSGAAGDPTVDLGATAVQTDQANVVTVAGGLTMDNQLGIRLREATVDGVNYIEHRATTPLTSNVTYTWPAPSAGFLRTDGSGVITPTPASGVGACSANTFVSTLSDAAAPTCLGITFPAKIIYRAAICQNTTASLAFSTPTSNAPTAACVTGSNTQFGVAQFTDASSQSIQDRFKLPSDWTSTIDLAIKWRSSVTSGDVKWQVATICVADAETGDPAFNTASTVTDTTKGTTLQFNDANITTVTVTGCAASEELLFKFLRDPADGADTLGATAELIELEWTVRRAI